MPLIDLCDHKCDIYHLTKKEIKPPYGKPTYDYAYLNNPDMKNVKCHFKIADDIIINSIPRQILSKETILIVPDISLNIKVNDKIVDKTTGLSYICQLPQNIRNHHLKIKMKLEKNL